MAWTIPELEMLRQPMLLRRLASVRDGIHEVLTPLSVTMARSPEPVPFAERESLSYRRVKAGSTWGRAHVCAWFHVEVDLRGLIGDELMAASGLALILDTDGEAILRNDAGEVVGMVTSRLTPLERHAPARAKTRVELTPELLEACAPAGRLSLWLDAGFNGKMVQPFGIARIRALDLVRIDRAREDAYLDLLTVAYASLRAGGLSDRYAVALDRGFAAAAEGDWSGVKSALAPVLGGPGCAAIAFTGLGHAHLDMAWLWPIRETRRKAHRTFRAQLDLLDAHPDFRFGASQPQQFKWIEQDDPELFARMQSAVAAGVFELQGGFWIEPDTNLPSGESLVRQAIHGQRYWESRFGQRVTTCWLPDAFGYSGALPQILRGAGMDTFLTIKLAWNEHNDFPHRSFVWEGIDGTGVLVHMPPEGTYTSSGTGLAIGTARDQYPEAGVAPIGMILFGTGDGGGGPSEVHLEVTKRSAHLLGMPTLVAGTAAEFFSRLTAYADVLPHWRGELYLEKHQGTLTTQGAIKAGNRRLEHELHDLEYLAAQSVWAGGGEWPSALLDRTWEELLLHQFHDMLPGSSIERVHRESREVYQRLSADVFDATAEVLAAEHSDDLPLAFVNTTPVPRVGWVEHGRQWWHHEAAPFETVALTPYAGEPGGALGFDDHSIWNDRLRVTFGEDGTITSLVDVLSGREHVRRSGALNRLVVHRDPFTMFNAWDIKPNYVDLKREVLNPVRVETSIVGPRVVRHQEFMHGDTRIRQDVVLMLGEDVVRFETDADLHERLRMLRAEFEPEAWSDVVTCEIQFGQIERSTRDDTPQERAQYEICGHRFVDVSTEAAGLSVLNDGKYGHRVKQGVISLNLLRAPVYPDRTADRGRHRFTYAIHPHEGGLGPSTTRHARHLNAPVVIAHVAAAPPAFVVEPANVLLDTVTLAASARGARGDHYRGERDNSEPGGGDLVLRLYESDGQECVATVALGPQWGDIDLSALRTTNFLLDDLGDDGRVDVDPDGALRIPLRPFQIVTLRIPQTR